MKTRRQHNVGLSLIVHSAERLPGDNVIEDRCFPLLSGKGRKGAGRSDKVLDARIGSERRAGLDGISGKIRKPYPGTVG